MLFTGVRLRLFSETASTEIATLRLSVATPTPVTTTSVSSCASSRRITLILRALPTAFSTVFIPICEKTNTALSLGTLIL